MQTIIGFAMARSTTYNLDIYQQRNPKASAYYKYVENHFEQVERAWDDAGRERLERFLSTAERQHNHFWAVLINSRLTI